MNDLNLLYEDLKKYSNFSENSENAEAFLETIDKIVMFQNIDSLQKILEYFDDDSEYNWVLESVSSSIEHYEAKVYVCGILSNLNFMYSKAPYWTVNLLYPILNDENYLEIFFNNIKLADKKSLWDIVEKIEEESNDYAETVRRIRENIK